MARNLRPGKIFIDWSQNNAAKTTVAPYSLRAQATPTVSTPLTWDEVDPRWRWVTSPHASTAPPRCCERVDEHGDLLADLLDSGPKLPARR